MSKHIIKLLKNQNVNLYVKKGCFEGKIEAI